MFRTINICLLTVLLSTVSASGHASDEDCSQIKAMTCGTILAISVAMLSVASVVYPPVVTSKLLGDDSEGLVRCVPAEIFNASTREKMRMAQTAFIVNAAVTPVATVSSSLAVFNEAVSNSKTASSVLLGVGFVSLLAGIGAELAAVIQSQKAYDHIFGGQVEYCSYPTTEGSKNDRKHELRTILGFGYLDVVVKGLIALGVPAVLIYELVKERCSRSLTSTVV